MRLHTHPHHIGRILPATGVAMLGLAMTMGPVSADGNNGTIKVDDVIFDSHPDNEPHVSCTFQVDFYGYEANILVTMVFSVQPPTGGPFEVIRTVDGTLDGDGSSGANQGGIDQNFTIDLTSYLATFPLHPNQGYHVKLHITAVDGTPQGSDGKSKVYWVGPCINPNLITTTTEATTTTTEATTTTTASVLGVVITKPATQVLGVQLPRTGLSEVFLMAGVTALSLGLVFEALAQMAKRRSTLS